MVTMSDQKTQLVDQFSRQAEGYSRLTAGMAGTDRGKAFRDLAGVHMDDVMLDVCCGPGTLALDFAPYVKHVTGLDLTAAMLAQARASQAQRGVANIDWIEGDAFSIPFGNAAFSLVTCSAALHHMVDPRAAFHEMVRVCRPGGRIAVRDVTPDAGKGAAYDRMEKLRDPSHTHALSPTEIASLGDDLPVDQPRLYSSVAADLSLDAILAASFPETCTIADIHALFLTDAVSREDCLGFDARLVDGEVRVSYRQTTAVWKRR